MIHALMRNGRVGGSIVLAGPDGSGKSTLARKLLEGPLAGERVLYLYGRPNVLPRPGIGRSTSAAVNRTKQPYPVWLSLLRTLYVFADFVLGWTFEVRPFVRAGGWVVIERGWWDLVVEPARFRLRGSTGLARCLGALAPQPDVFLILEASSKAVRSRKNQLSEAEVRRQNRVWKTVLPRRVRRTYLDADRPADLVFQQAEAALLRLHDRPPRQDRATPVAYSSAPSSDAYDVSNHSS